MFLAIPDEEPDQELDKLLEFINEGDGDGRELMAGDVSTMPEDDGAPEGSDASSLPEALSVRTLQPTPDPELEALLNYGLEPPTSLPTASPTGSAWRASDGPESSSELDTASLTEKAGRSEDGAGEGLPLQLELSEKAKQILRTRSRAGRRGGALAAGARTASLVEMKASLKNTIHDFLFNGDGNGEEEVEKSNMHVLEDGTAWKRIGDDWIMLDPESEEAERIANEEAKVAKDSTRLVSRISSKAKKAKQKEDAQYEKQLKRDVIKKLCQKAGDSVALKKQCQLLGISTEAAPMFGSAGLFGLDATSARQQMEDLHKKELEYYEAHSKPQREKQEEWAQRQAAAAKRAADAKKDEQERADREMAEISAAGFEKATDIKRAIAALNRIVETKTNWDVFHAQSPPPRPERNGTGAPQNLTEVEQRLQEYRSNGGVREIISSTADFAALKQMTLELREDLGLPAAAPPPSKASKRAARRSEAAKREAVAEDVDTSFIDDLLPPPPRPPPRRPSDLFRRRGKGRKVGAGKGANDKADEDELDQEETKPAKIEDLSEEEMAIIKCEAALSPAGVALPELHAVHGRPLAGRCVR
ncbi:hypothetical protein CYMTET_42749 [Cymbomonas tetramitiformis]|uniref:Uncharacterized protein n=1 Tax=Cymbomonas tetramitiformis TaxID=36881 RepID=A0AAE0F0P7_9CHLO|nr:hypothetical protein CYMTET_42749 [Cymbomonas tetramitiformis]